MRVAIRNRKCLPSDCANLLRLANVSIYRPGAIASATKTGASNLDDFRVQLMREVMRQRAYPKDMTTALFRFVPVDQVASKIVQDALKQETVSNLL